MRAAGVVINGNKKLVLCSKEGCRAHGFILGNPREHLTRDHHLSRPAVNDVMKEIRTRLTKNDIKNISAVAKGLGDPDGPINVVHGLRLHNSGYQCKRCNDDGIRFFCVSADRMQKHIKDAHRESAWRLQDPEVVTGGRLLQMAYATGINPFEVRFARNGNEGAGQPNNNALLQIKADSQTFRHKPPEPPRESEANVIFLRLVNWANDITDPDHYALCERFTFLPTARTHENDAIEKTIFLLRSYMLSYVACSGFMLSSAGTELLEALKTGCVLCLVCVWCASGRVCTHRNVLLCHTQNTPQQHSGEPQGSRPFDAPFTRLQSSASERRYANEVCRYIGMLIRQFHDPNGEQYPEETFLVLDDALRDAVELLIDLLNEAARRRPAHVPPMPPSASTIPLVRVRVRDDAAPDAPDEQDPEQDSDDDSDDEQQFADLRDLEMPLPGDGAPEPDELTERIWDAITDLLVRQLKFEYPFGMHKLCCHMYAYFVYSSANADGSFKPVKALTSRIAAVQYVSRLAVFNRVKSLGQNTK
jgi:Orsellinic acid/F9775 biosynthesis cluster protein D